MHRKSRRRLRAPPLPAPAPEKGASTDWLSPWYVILETPRDIDALWQKVKHPDLLVIKPDEVRARAAENGERAGPDEPAPSLVESVQVRGNIEEDFAKLAVEVLVVVKGMEPVWAPIRLDGQRLTRASEGSLELGLRRVETGQWQVKLDGQGRHRIQVELAIPIIVAPGRRSISLAIPEAASTGVDLDFSRGESEIAVGDDEVFGTHEPKDGKKTHLTAHLEPRPELVVSWMNASEAGNRALPLLTAKGEIAIDVDEEQVRVRASWAVRCVRGTARSLEMRLAEDVEVTEFQVDEQPAEAHLERVRGMGKATIRLVDPLRVGGVRRVVMKTRQRSPVPGPAWSHSWGFRSRTHANKRDSSESPRVRTCSSGRRRREACAGSTPRNFLRTCARPSTSLAFEFLDQPFLLDLAVEPSPPLFKADLRTVFRIDRDRARSETTIELERVRGRASEVELWVAKGLQLISVGPPDVVASSHLSPEIDPTGFRGSNTAARRLKVRLTTLGRDANKVTLKLAGLQRISVGGSVNLGLFTPLEATPSNSTYVLLADRDLAIEPDDDTGRIRRLSAAAPAGDGSKAVWPWTVLGEDPSQTPLLLASDSSAPFLPIRIVPPCANDRARYGALGPDVPTMGRRARSDGFGGAPRLGDGARIARAGRDRRSVGAPGQGACGTRRTGPGCRWRPAVFVEVFPAGR